MTLEDWNTVLQVASASLLGLLFLVGALTIVVDRIISKRQESRIASAQRDAAAATKEAAEARDGTARALGDAAAANERTSRLELESARQRERAARAEKDLLELQERLRHRRIVGEQRERLIATLRNIPKGPVSLTCVLGDGEGIAFANDVVEVLRAAGWEVDGVNQGAFTPTNPVGFFVRVRSAVNAPPYIRALLEAFNSTGIRLDAAEVPTMAENVVAIVVGNKP